MRKLLFVLLLITFINSTYSKTIYVGQNEAYKTIGSASKVVQAGDTIFAKAGIYAGNEYISNLKGNHDNWIYILSDSLNPAVYRGGSQAIHFSEVEYLKFSGFVFEGQTQNGVNIDDGGTFDTPSKYLIIEKCKWLSMEASGNCDELKLSGIDSFTVRNCTFQNGSLGGSLIDMVGCHFGIFERNFFENGGSNCIQAKGGSHDILIKQNKFINGGQRAINIGGSTGLEYFRPQNADYEASRIAVHSNIFVGSTTPFAFVGAVHSEVLNNTIIAPDRWCFRILQENTFSRFQQCGNNIIANNIFYFDNLATNENCINIGSNTKPETFLSANNLWYNTQNANWAGPNKNVYHQDNIVGEDPLFNDIYKYDFSLKVNSPAIQKGLSVEILSNDFNDKPFKNPPSIGAFEYYSSSSIEKMFNSDEFILTPNPAKDFISISPKKKMSGKLEISIFNIGNTSIHNFIFEEMYDSSYKLNISELSQGTYFVIITCGNQFYRTKFIKIK